MVDDVVVSTADLDDETVRHVAAACDRLQARYVAWTEGEVHLGRSSVLVAGLPAGQRRVPPHLMKLCTEQHPGTPLLLLCQEGLVSPTVSLHGGQIVLVGPPFSAARIFGRLAVLQAERDDPEAPSVVTSTDDPSALVWTRERLHADVWVASIGSRGLAGGAPLAPVLANQPEGVTALLPCRPGVAIDEALRLELVDLVGGEAPSPDRLRAARNLAPEVAMIHFDRRSEQWRVVVPQAVHMLWLHSDQRLPALWNLGAALTATGTRTLRAASGDLMVALTGLPEDDADEVIGADHDHLMRRGGHTLLAALERRLQAVPRSMAGVLVEVRA